jgi:hypothetical protein
MELQKKYGGEDSVPTNRDNIIARINQYRSAGFSLQWDYNKDGMVLVYVDSFASKKVIIEAPVGIMEDLRREVEGN